MYVYATDMDHHTYSDIKLKDSRKEVNRALNKMVQNIALATSFYNFDKKGNPKKDDTYLEYLFSKFYKDSLGTDAKHRFAFHGFETCIMTQYCMGMQNIDRLIFEKGENVFARAGYNSITAKFSTAIINLCGVRISADKLTHMFLDGFYFYNAHMDKNLDYSEDEIRKMSEAMEKRSMGLGFTGVYSNADIEANIQGVKLFKKLFNGKDSYLSNVDGQLYLKKEIDICDYINPSFDELKNPNKYIKKPELTDIYYHISAGEEDRVDKIRYEMDLRRWKKKIDALDREIAISINGANYRQNCFTEVEREKFDNMIINRKFNFSDEAYYDIPAYLKLSMGVDIILSSIFESVTRNAYLTFTRKPKYKTRKKSYIDKELPKKTKAE